MTDLITIFIDGGEYVNRAAYIEQRDEASKLRDRIEQLQVELEATQDNEHRIVEANKLDLIRIAELERSIDQLQQVSLANSELIEELEDIIATHCDPFDATPEVAIVINECYAKFCEREDRE